MFAVIRTGGKQYKVAKNDVIVVEKLPGEPGAAVELGEVLMLGGAGSEPVTGTPTVAGARVAATVVAQKQGEKVIIFKKRRRQNYRRKNGHRQELTVLKVTDILKAGESPEAAAGAAAPKKASRPRAKKAAAAESKE